MLDPDWGYVCLLVCMLYAVCMSVYKVVCLYACMLTCMYACMYAATGGRANISLRKVQVARVISATLGHGDANARSPAHP